MNPIDIIIVVCCVVFLGLVFGFYIYKKIKKKPTGECASCHNKGKNLVHKYNKKYKK
jgi:hypothetical protein